MPVVQGLRGVSVKLLSKCDSHHCAKGAEHLASGNQHLALSQIAVPGGTHERLPRFIRLGPVSLAHIGGLYGNLEISSGGTLWLTSQIQRCFVSVGANIAEGCGKIGNNEFQRFLQIAGGSPSEPDYELLLAKQLGYIATVDYSKLADELAQVRKMLSSLLRKVTWTGGLKANC